MVHKVNFQDLTPDLLLQIRKGVDEFNSGKFFECHETLEEVWHGIRGPARDLFQGLIQVAVGFYHLDNRNLKGSLSQLEKGLHRLEGYDDSSGGFELRKFRIEVRLWLEKLRSGGEISGHVRDLPKLRFVAVHAPND